MDLQQAVDAKFLLQETHQQEIFLMNQTFESQLQTHQQESDKIRGELGNQITTLRSEVRRLKGLIQDKERVINQLKSELTTVEVARDTAVLKRSNSWDQAQKSLSHKKEELRSLVMQLSSAQEENLSIKKQLEERNREIENLREASEKQTESLKTKIQELEDIIVQTFRAKKEKEQEVLSLKRENFRLSELSQQSQRYLQSKGKGSGDFGSV